MPTASEAFAGQIVLVITLLVTTAATMWKTSRDQKHQIDLLRAQHALEAQDREAKAAAAKLDLETTAAALAAKTKADQDAAAAALAVKTAAEAEQVRQRLELATLTTQQRIDDTATRLRDRLEDTTRNLELRAVASAVAVKSEASTMLDAQTSALTQVIETATAGATDKADQAFNKANDVNTKIEKLHEANRAQAAILERQGAMLERLLGMIERRSPHPHPDARPEADRRAPVEGAA